MIHLYMNWNGQCGCNIVVYTHVNLIEEDAVDLYFNSDISIASNELSEYYFEKNQSFFLYRKKYQDICKKIVFSTKLYKKLSELLLGYLQLIKLFTKVCHNVYMNWLI